MKVIISSKGLAEGLNKLDLDNFNVDQIVFADNLLHFFSNDMHCEIYCESNENDIIITQDSQRWDWAKDLVNKVDEQPIVLQIESDSLRIIFDY